MKIKTKKKKDNLGDRMKDYENISRFSLMRRNPVIVRVDGRAFHTFTRGMPPFYEPLRLAMINAALTTSREMQGFKIGYHQSDEVSFLLTDYDELTTDAWFGNLVQKIASISSSLMSVSFDRTFRNDNNQPAIFDARVFSIPKEEVANYFVWRAKDWYRNSVTMYASQFYSHKELHGKGRADRHEMLFQKGKNWVNDISEPFRNGTFFTQNWSRSDILPKFDEISKVTDPFVFPKNI